MPYENVEIIRNALFVWHVYMFDIMPYENAEAMPHFVYS
jgi:hypothetical protein